MDDGLEIMCCAMKNDAEGATLCPRNETPDFYDVEVRRRNEATGEIEIIEEHEDIADGEAAEKIVCEMEAKYPDASVEYVHYI